VVALWARHTGAATLTGTTVALAVGRLAGLLAGFGSLLLILMTARTEPLERRVGSTRLVRLHASWGRATLLLLVVHVCAITLGYAGLVHVFLLREAWILVSRYPYVWLALVGAVLLALVGALSVRAGIRALGYQTWYRIHLLTYVAVAVSVAHQLFVGSDFVHDPLTRGLWTALYLVVGLFVAYYRICRPLLHAVRRQSKIVAVVPEGETVVSIAVRSDGRPPRAEPGQFFRLRFLTRGLWSETHPFSVSALPTGDTLRFTVKARGGHTARLQAVSPGTRVLLMGPHGSPAAVGNGRDVVLICAGIGITAVRPLFEFFSASGVKATLIYRCRGLQEAPLADELDAVVARWGTSVVYLHGSREAPGNKLGAAEVLALVPDVARREVYICAPPGLADSLVESFQELGVPRGRLHREFFGLDDLSGWSGARVSVGALLAVPLLTVVALAAGPTRQPGPSALKASPEDSNVVRLPASGSPSHPADAVTVDGPIERTLFNSVQVRVVLRQGRLISVTALALPNVDARSRQLSALAGPILAREALASNGAVVDAVSGASYTSGAYVESLQAALDRARGAGG
jgi:predicted ferric reductase/uncharacterized protein with FMN-binding domain